jgi:hypothetical protein
MLLTVEYFLRMEWGRLETSSMLVLVLFAYSFENMHWH